VMTLGDSLGYFAARVQPTKLVAMEAIWKTEPPPVAFNVVALPSNAQQRNLWEIQIPALLSILVTHSLDQSITGADELVEQAKTRIRNGMPAVDAMKVLSGKPDDAAALATFQQHRVDLGYGFLVLRYAPDGDLSKVTDAMIEKAALDTLPEVWIIFWAFRAMVACGVLMIAYFVLAWLFTLADRVHTTRWFQWAAVLMIPVPFIACEAGWLVAEVGRQPWTVYEVLPTWMSASTHSVGYMIASLGGFVVLYTIFAIIELYLMVYFIRRGPEDAPHGARRAAAAY